MKKPISSISPSTMWLPCVGSNYRIWLRSLRTQLLSISPILKTLSVGRYTSHSSWSGSRLPFMSILTSWKGRYRWHTRTSQVSLVGNMHSKWIHLLLTSIFPSCLMNTCIRILKNCNWNSQTSKLQSSWWCHCQNLLWPQCLCCPPMQTCPSLRIHWNTCLRHSMIYTCCMTRTSR